MRRLGGSALCVVLSRGDGTAIKIPSPEGVSKIGRFSTFETRFQRELAVADRVRRHPGILVPNDLIYVGLEELGGEVTFTNLSPQDRIPALVMPEGGPDLIAEANRSRPSTERALYWLQQIADALEHCHSLGVVHRDLKLSNVVLDADRVRLIDFGAAIHSDDALSDFGRFTLVGTPTYLPPSAANLSPVVLNTPPGTDTYALGVIARALLSGKSPKTDPARALRFVPDRLRSVLQHAQAFGGYTHPKDLVRALVESNDIVNSPNPTVFGVNPCTENAQTT